jgi:hypothetical protein
VQRTQVHLEEILRAACVRLCHDVGAPCPVTISIVKVQSKEERGEGREEAVGVEGNSILEGSIIFSQLNNKNAFLPYFKESLI